jgi:enamine deaminase RidA (YjgF/YER057c/UK114 family)
MGTLGDDPRRVTNPDTLFNPVRYGFSHAVSVPGGGDTVFIAGQWASDLDGELVDGDFGSQVELAFENLKVALESEGLGFENVVRLGSFVVGDDPATIDTYAAVLYRIWADRPPAQTLSRLFALALPGMLFEIDAVAVRSPAAG